MTRPRAQIVVELPAIRHNVGVLREHTGVDVMTVVKADGYGHGMVPSARAAREGGADLARRRDDRRGAGAPGGR